MSPTNLPGLIPDLRVDRTRSGSSVSVTVGTPNSILGYPQADSPPQAVPLVEADPSAYTTDQVGAAQIQKTLPSNLARQAGGGAHDSLLRATRLLLERTGAHGPQPLVCSHLG